jgi:hypothetical protein
MNKDIPEWTSKERLLSLWDVVKLGRVALAEIITNLSEYKKPVDKP